MLAIQATIRFSNVVEKLCFGVGAAVVDSKHICVPMDHAMSMQSKMPAEEDVRTALRSVIDPEVGLNIVDLGLVYGVEISDNKLHVDLTMTTPACPMGEMILDNARHALAALLPAGAEIELNLVWEPPWGPDKMGEHARKYFGWG